MSSYTYRLSATAQGIDSNQNQVWTQSTTVSFPYTLRKTYTYVKPSGSTVYPVPFDDIVTSAGVYITADQNIDILINGQYILAVNNFFTDGLVTSVSFRNNTGVMANISVEVYQ